MSRQDAAWSPRLGGDKSRKWLYICPQSKTCSISMAILSRLMSHVEFKKEKNIIGYICSTCNVDKLIISILGNGRVTRIKFSMYKISVKPHKMAL